MIITAELAQHIVDNIMPLVQQNINIMDSAGVIVGSGQKSRLNTYHQGAMEVIRSGQVVEIFPEDMERYPGALPGLNWPIVLGSQVVGAVGVSGHPDKVRNTTKLVKMVTELILERENLVEEFRANLQLREQFMQHVLSDRYQDNAIAKTAKLLRFSLNLPRLVAVVSVGLIIRDACNQYGVHDLVALRTRETLAQLLEHSSLLDSQDLFVFFEDELVILKQFPADAGEAEFYQWGSAILSLLGGPQQQGLRMGLGSFTGSPAELHESYKEALFSQNNKMDGTAVASIYDFDILVDYLIKEPGAIHSCLALKKLKDLILAQLDRKYDMRNTVNALLDNNLNVSSAAKALFVHRNTLVFRLEKLKELTGLCPSQSLNHAMLCRILFSY
ncbi:CdaR family transcriptional regulator [Sporomusa sphaeroides]|uniref:Carbohydrate diacid regulator n=1 Tax=Sporomusa sphaeroides DSM 2875 TaxID=1337886 RepID=A0ABP2CBA3_9FIRM|nr:sugar diacid recognition domain-containing protein [Sporomusa sphaeroides]OLS55017.1 carbohydrate diacid regulator [Sporomusa sphaeroides DSM 2875]CVK19463.1 Carbohydrate diacid regulator [Sporomusa sphaeroides DSM 2875]